MILIVCLDDRNGMLFHDRRQSQDKILRARILKLCHGVPLWMNAYSASQFEESNSDLRVAEDYLQVAGAGEFCFVENADLSDVLDRTEGIVIYRWNRSYPADVTFPEALFSEKWTLVSKEDFAGSSHDRITQEVYDL